MPRGCAPDGSPSAPEPLWQASIITVAELSFQGKLIASSTFKNTEIFTLVAVWYLAMCVPLILLVGRLEKKFGRK